VPPKAKLTIEELLAAYPDAVTALANDVRPLVRAAMPDATETAYPGWRAIAYRDPRAGYVCGIFLFTDHVRLLFEHGHLLPDPAGVLEGTTKQTRHITLRPGEPIPAETIQDLVHVGAELKTHHT
jgi:hypothetical protein